MAFFSLSDITGNAIVQDFTNAFNQIIGKGASDSLSDKGGTVKDLFDSDFGGATKLEQDKFLGNTQQSDRVKYGFALLTRAGLLNSSSMLNPVESILSHKFPTISKAEAHGHLFYLQVPPKSIKQRELFANNIQATRRGVIVESEGVVFKEITIQGSTGIFPGIRGGSNTPHSNLFTDPFKAPGAPAGLDPKLGTSLASNVKTISGYEEFLRLRQFFLKYAKQKLDMDGDLFLVWINQKDNETLIVEPMDFTMDRNSKSPLTYDYTIVLKAIGNLAAVVSAVAADKDLTFFQKAANLSANVSAAIQQGRAVINQSTRMLTRITQSIDQTINNPLRQTQYACEDIAGGITQVLSLPSVLLKTASEACFLVRDSISPFKAIAPAPVGKLRTDVDQSSGMRLETASKDSFTTSTLNSIANDNRTSLPKSFIQTLKDNTSSLADNVADYTNLGSTSYDTIKNRTSTITASPLKVASDDEFLLLGTLHSLINNMNNVLATNTLFASDADAAFAAAQAPFQSPNLPPEFQVNLDSPKSVQQITIRQGDTLERIAQQYLGDALKWIEIAVLNELKPPYINDIAGEGVKAYGQTLLIGKS